MPDMIEQLIKPSYWFTFQPPSVGGVSGNVIFAFFLLLFVVGIVGRVVAVRKTDDRFLQQAVTKIASMLSIMGILGVLLYFFSFERIQFLGARFWYLVWMGGLILWIVILLRDIKSIPGKRALALERQKRTKYFPPRKRKRKK
jgi:hypothetical protein